VLFLLHKFSLCAFEGMFVEDQNALIQQPVADDNGSLDSAPSERDVYASSSDELLVIPRVVFNYGVIAVTFFVLGIVIGGIAASRLGEANRAENEALIEQAVAQALASNVETQRTGPDPNQVYDVSADADPFRGPEDAPITIIEFGDFKCGYCARFHNETLTPLLNDYEGQIRIVFRDYPILGATSLSAAFAAECANEQDVFWPYHDLLYANQQILNRDAYIAFAEELELDIEAFTTCLDSEQYRDEVFGDYSAGQALGVTGTPTFYVNGRPIVGAQPYQAFATAIDRELAALSSQSEAAS
jgi:protein-disulfide isomerase